MYQNEIRNEEFYRAIQLGAFCIDDISCFTIDVMKGHVCFYPA
jgi:hypothetical protein